MRRVSFILMAGLTSLAIGSGSAAAAEQNSPPPLLVRQPDGDYKHGDLNKLPAAVTGQPCYRYNNYWCLKGTKWEGQERVGEQRLAVFKDPTDAARALAITLHAYRFKYGLKTPRQIMSRFILSPNCREGGRTTNGCDSMWGRVDKYAARIAKALGISPNEPVAVFKTPTTVDKQRARILFREMAHIEIGQTLRVTDEVIDQGLKRAGFEAS